jgi:hypothetical protein
VGAGRSPVFIKGQAPQSRGTADAMPNGAALRVSDMLDGDGLLTERSANQRLTSLGSYAPHFPRAGFYFLQYTVTMP